MRTLAEQVTRTLEAQVTTHRARHNRSPLRRRYQMLTNRLLLIASLLGVTACSDQPTGPKLPAFIEPATGVRVELNGIVVLPGSEMAPAFLRVGSELVPLRGSEAVLITHVEGAQVSVIGTRDSDPGVVVESFQVLTMRGRAVVDGTLELVPGGAYAVRLATGALYMIADAPADLITHVGARIWLTTSATEALEFGIIRDIQ